MSLGALTFAGFLGGAVVGRCWTGLVGRCRRRRRKARRQRTEMRTSRSTKAAPTPMPTSTHVRSPNTTVLWDSSESDMGAAVAPLYRFLRIGGTPRVLEQN
uniref:Uncharacterized protein n=1 Tax=Arundo donax TaxID=35708 RepID=A0A0A9F2N3_ARUDO